MIYEHKNAIFSLNDIEYLGVLEGEELWTNYGLRDRWTIYKIHNPPKNVTDLHIIENNLNIHAFDMPFDQYMDHILIFRTEKKLNELKDIDIWAFYLIGVYDPKTTVEEAFNDGLFSRMHSVDVIYAILHNPEKLNYPPNNKDQKIFVFVDGGVRSDRL